ncbi:AAC(3) family N-acetyltransferase [Streptomyces marokkonensis]|uniref:AAC(3) family N-acetyltransferase n=1 Tax=Streptomyces marokkonensis TaxID=324855 RepID=UPI00244DD740|nr:AAC(3) family N-acetyltransferase [Streptomyces marokkonensis]
MSGPDRQRRSPGPTARRPGRQRRARFVERARRRVHSDEPAVSDHDFPAVREACAERAGLCRTGSVSGARAVLLPLRPRVDFAARWFGATRSRTVR